MPTLHCGNNWFSGAVERNEEIVDWRLVPVYFAIAEGQALAQAWKELMDDYNLPCPEEDCDWVLKVVCTEKAIAAPGPIPEDYEKLQSEYLHR